MEQRSPEWFEARRGKLTGTRMAAIIRGGPTQWNKLMDVLDYELSDKWVIPEEINTRAIKRGRALESVAIANYEMIRLCSVERVGFIVHPDHDFVGVSLDGIIPSKKTVEVKCPDPESKANMHELTVLMGMPEAHMPQVQAGLWVTGLDVCDFISFDPDYPDYDKQVIVDPIVRDEMYIEIMRDRCLEFYQRFVIGQRFQIASDIVPTEIPVLFA